MNEIATYIAERAKQEPLFGGKLKIAFPEGVVLIDGSGTSNEISNLDIPSDCTISMKIKTFNSTHDGKTDAMVAFLLGRVKFKGDGKLALKLKSLI